MDNVWARLDHERVQGSKPLLTCPLIDILENMAVNCLHVGVIEVAFDRRLRQFQNSGASVALFQKAQLDSVRFPIWVARSGEFIA